MTRPSPGAMRLMLLMETDPKAFVAAVRAALEAAGHYPGASDALEIPTRTLRRWAEEYPAITKGLELRKPGKPAAEKPPAKRAKKRAG